MIKTFKVEGYYIEKRKYTYIPFLTKWYIMKEVSCTNTSGDVCITQHIVDSYWDSIKAHERLYQLNKCIY